MAFDFVNGASCFVTGTDTGVGKTFVSARLLRDWRARGADAVGMKPICCGERDDAEHIRAACDGRLSLDEVNPVWLRPPVAPFTASVIEERAIDLAQIRERFTALKAKHPIVLVEGVGGWRVPILRDYFVSDLAAELALPVLVVAANRLGMLNHALLTVESIRTAGLECAGIILSEPTPNPPDDPAAVTNRAILEELLPIPILAEFPHEPARNLL